MGAVTAAIIVGAGAIVGGVAAYAGSQQQASAAKNAANAQAQAGQAAIAANADQFQQMKAMVQPYADAGYDSLKAQLDLIGQNGPVAQQAAINSIQSDPNALALAQQGEQGILANASATGGLRGGNIQAALAQFRPQLLQSMINDRYSKLQNITQLGQAAASQQASASLANGQQTANLLTGIGNAQAQGLIGAGAANAAGYNALGQGVAGVGNAFGGLDYLKFRQTGTGMFS
jgi:hypothetical protein